ncbi:winged helix-turn-helix domain-containing protein [Enterococcus faecalis]
MKIGLINCNPSELEHFQSNWLSKNINEIIEIENEHEASIQNVDALILFKNEQHGIRALCEMLRKINALEAAIPVWVVVPNRVASERIIYINFGACGVFTEDFSVEEIYTIIENNLRFKTKVEKKDKGVHLDSANMKLQIGKNDISLTKTEYYLLDYLHKNKNRVCTYNELAEKVLSEENGSKAKNYKKIQIANIVFRIRQKITTKCPDSPDNVIQTIRSVGYKLI